MLMTIRRLLLGIDSTDDHGGNTDYLWLRHHASGRSNGSSIVRHSQRQIEVMRMNTQPSPGTVSLMPSGRLAGSDGGGALRNAIHKGGCRL